MKIIAFILSLSICMVSVSAYAQTGTDKKSEYYTYSSYKTGYGLPQEGYHLPELPDNAVLLDDIPEEELAEFNDLIYTALKDRAEKIPGIEKYFHLFGNDNKTMAPYYYRVITDHPELYYVKTSYSLSSTVYPDRKEISISPVYNPEFNEDSDKLFNDSVRKILWETVYDGMTDEEIALSVHDYLVDHITYYTDYASEDAPDSIYSAYGAVVNGSAVCQGYSLAYSLLMHMCGIDALYVESDEMNHGWNAIKLDDEWYHVDVTWDDCFERNYPGKLMAAHFYFLRSDEYFKNPPEDYTPHTVWDSDVPLCTSNKYNDQKYVFNEKYNIGIGLYKYYNGYFYAANTYENKYGKFLFDGSERKELTKDEYDAIIEEISKLPPAPTASPAPTKAPVPSDSPAATKAPVPSDSPAATKAPVPSNSPAATNAPVPSNSPAATNAPSPEPYREYYKLKSTRIDDNGFNFEFERIDEGSDTQTFIFAVYDGENMKNVYIRYINSDDTVIVPADNVESHNTAKIFIWDSFDSMRPVFNPQECNIIFDQ